MKYALIQELASEGHNPDTEIANYYQAKYDEFMRDVESRLSDGITHRSMRRYTPEEDW